MTTISIFSKLSSHRERGIGGESFWLVLGQAANTIGGLVGVKILTGCMSPTSYGELALGITGVTLLQQTAFAGPGGAAMRFFSPAKESGELNPYLKAIWKVMRQRILIASIICLILLALLWLVTGSRWLNLAVAAFLFALLSNIPSVLDAMQNAARHRVVVAWHQGFGQWLRFSLAWVLIITSGEPSSAAMWGYSLAACLMLSSQLLLFKIKFPFFPISEHKGGETKSRNWYAEISEYSLPFSLWGIFTWMQIASERWALQKYATTADVGIYAVLYQIGYYPLCMLTEIALQLITPIIFARFGDSTNLKRREAGRRLNFIVLYLELGLTFIFALVAYLFKDLIFAILVADEFRDMAHLLPVMVMSGGIFACGQIASILFLAETKSNYLLAPKIGTAVMDTCLNLVGAWWMGVEGVAFASFTFSLAYMLWVLLIGPLKKKRLLFVKHYV